MARMPTLHFQDGEKRTARVVRYHPVHDLALLKVEATGLTPFHLNLSESIDVGEAAYALGTPYDIDLGASVTKGIISGKRKDAHRTLIQTDVSISPGNSGGALIDESGTLIGIVNEKVLGMGVEGIGFAIYTHVIPEALKSNSGLDAYLRAQDHPPVALQVAQPLFARPIFRNQIRHLLCGIPVAF